MADKIIIKNMYGEVILTEPNGNKISAKTVDELMVIMDSKCHEYNNPTVVVESYASDKDQIIDASDLTLLAGMCCWGKDMYEGDCIKFTLTAEYTPENK